MVQLDKKDKVDDLTDAAKNMKLDGKGTGHDEKLIIALDFGTTFSGIAFCFANQRDPKVVSILEWPGAEGEYTPKIPTIIAYDEHDKSKFTWGASVDRTKDNIQGVKLLLDPDQERPLYLPTSTMKWDLKRLPKAPMEVAADFIGAMYKHALSEIAKEVPASYLSVCQKEFVLSVPAIWSDKAKDLTIKAARFAGIHPVTLIKEPEAAALYTMYALDNALQVGDAFVVCDAGGGTVDLISYEVTSITPKLQLKELVTGTGGMAGSLGLNKRFNEALKDIIGEDEWSRLRTHKAFFHAEKQFDREVKKAFRGRDSEEYFINFPMANLDDDPENGLEMNCWRLTGTTLKKIFAPLINDIIRLVDHQVKSVQLARPGKPVSGIFLVGGFGSSQYLKGCIQKEYPNIQVMQPNDAWAAIVKGAALSRLPREAKVVSIKSTRHYGVEVLEVWNDARDAGMPSRSVRDGVKRCAIMWWYIHVGNDLKRDQKIKFPFLHDIPIDYKPENLVFRETLYEAADTEAPSHRSKGEKLKFNCSLTADCRNVDPSHFIKMTSKDGTQYYDVSFDLCVTLESAIMKFSMEINGKEMGSVYANYD